MSALSFVARIARKLYGLEARLIESLDEYALDWRGIYRVQDAQGGVWLMRLLQLPAELGALSDTARLLEWLAHQQYLAPAVRATVDQQLVGIIDGWSIMLLSYVDGSMLRTCSADDLGAFAQTVGRLHSLRVDDPSSFAQSRCHPDTIATAAQQLMRYRANVPPVFHTMVSNLHTSMIALQLYLPQQLCITHGDCWYRNAIKTPAGQVTLIDWDCAGLGLPLLDLGYLLLTAHFDLSRPLALEPNEANIKAIMQGYQQHRRIPAAERAHMVDAIRFLVAFQLGSSIADGPRVHHPDFPFVLEKLQARYQATQAIAAIAAASYEL